MDLEEGASKDLGGDIKVQVMPVCSITIVFSERSTLRVEEGMISAQRRQRSFPNGVFLVPTRRRGNPFGTRQRPVSVVHATLARRQCIPTPARGNEKTPARGNEKITISIKSICYVKLI